jgi:hypothetical protein
MRKLNQRGDVLAAIAVSVTVGCIVTLVIVGISALVNHNNKWNEQRGRGDAPVGQVDTKPRDIYQMPDRFSNFAEVCDRYGNAVVMTTTDNGKALWAIKDGCE